ncbi:MAG: HNH endonuclease [Anaerolineae bacterium CG03_land_8_20_14_0_80_58_20]|nr:MAG: HNH endonuclease [Anaerolineae bacterium CG1_02_58_13]PIV26869.1 MAG: HNH endonuclease [Anaerolineae bacterium CG03_land_8_20_14_0_80_58_20]
MSAETPASLRKLVKERAKGKCEYCLMPQSASAFEHEPDHIIPIQHGGKTEAGNLALACLRCNRRKGPNVGSFDPESGALVPFFHPRAQKWRDHFRLDGGVIQPITPEARVTVKILQLNDEARIEERERLIALGAYP